MTARGLQGNPPDGERVPFSYDAGDFVKVEAHQRPKATIQDTGGFPADLPARACFRLEDKRPLPALEKGGRYFHPTYSFICLIPLSDESEKDFAKAYPNFNSSARELRVLLDKRPKSFDKKSDIPDVPFNNAGHSILGKVEYLDFKGGAGVIFLTQYTQEMWPNPVNNEELTYNFQGLTKDGKHYIAARFAVTHPSLPKGIDFTEHIKRDEGLLYLMEGEKRLGTLPEESFRPSLKRLKAIVSSIDVQTNKGAP